MAIVSEPSVEEEKHKNTGDVEKTFVLISHADIPCLKGKMDFMCEYPKC